MSRKPSTTTSGYSFTFFGVEPVWQKAQVCPGYDPMYLHGSSAPWKRWAVLLAGWGISSHGLE